MQNPVQIAAASINPADIRLPSGDFRDVVPLTFPHIPGNDLAGTVSEIGAGVTVYQVGDEIFGQAVPRALRAMAGATRPSLSTGSLAEYAVFEADTPFLAHRPAGLDLEQAAALPAIGGRARTERSWSLCESLSSSKEALCPEALLKGDFRAPFKSGICCT